MSLFNDRIISVFKEVKPDAFIQGMAMGADLLAGKIALEQDVPLISAMPWPTHYKTIRPEWMPLYREMLDGSAEVYPVTEVDDYPGPWVYHKRNEWMVNECDRVLSWWDGRETGGTYAAIKYAQKIGKLVRNIYAK